MTSPLRDKLLAEEEQVPNNNPSVGFRGSLFRFWNPTGSYLKKYTLFDWSELRDGNFYRGGLAEFIGTFLFTSLHFGITGSSQRSPFFLGAFSHFLAYWFLLITFGPMSGGHLNPLITASTLCTGKTSVPRAVTYMGLQCMGAVFAALSYMDMFDESIRSRTLECGYISDGKTGGEYILFQIIQNLTFLFFLYAIAFDSRASSMLGYFKAPMVLSISYGLLIFSTLSLSYVESPDSKDDYRYSDDGTEYGYRFGGNLAFCVASKFYHDRYDDDTNSGKPENFEDGTGFTFLSLLLSVVIHSLLYYLLAPSVPHYENEEEEKSRNKQILLVEMA